MPLLLPGFRLRCGVCGLDHYGRHVEQVCDGDLHPFGGDDAESPPDRTLVQLLYRKALRPWLN